MNKFLQSGGKYRNKKCEYNGEKFDSKKEMGRWFELKMLEAAGEIHALRRQVSFELLPAIREAGRVVQRAMTYKADYTYHTKDGAFVVEDVKGYKTPVYDIKKKCMRALLGVKVVEI